MDTNRLCPPVYHLRFKLTTNTLDDFKRLGALNEGATRIAFQNLLNDWSRERKLGVTVLAEQTIETASRTNIRLDGVLVDDLKLRRGYWEAKDTADRLDLEIRKKIAKGYPLVNTVFEDTQTAVLYQDNREILRSNLREPSELRQLLDEFVGYRPPRIEQFHKAVAEFRERIPELALTLTTLIDEAKRTNTAFKAALQSFLELCRSSLNPETTPAQVEDMLKQHILTERIFRSIFQNPDFVRRNAVAQELEKMVTALTSRSFSRDVFLKRLDYFYEAIEENARTISDYSEKQALLNALYEQFFQAYSVKTADTHGIVYTPSEIVRWMVASVQAALQNEFGQSLDSEGVHIIDPCVGTGTFVMELLRRIPTSVLPQKYHHELHANEVQLLPYYIAAQNIEHEYSERTGTYEPFEGICFADTLDIMDINQTHQLGMFAPPNVTRIEAQKQAPIRVIIGNPPYNAGQENENDNNKNRKHPTVDKRISETYAKASRARLQKKLYDPYVKFFRWATDRLGDREGIICFVSNNSFLNQYSFDGMRHYLAEDFSKIFIFDLGGNVRKNPKLSGSKNNVFGIQVGVTITLLIKGNKGGAASNFTLHYARLDEYWAKEQKLEYLTKFSDYTTIQWERLYPDNRDNWLNDGVNADYEALIALSSHETKTAKKLDVETIFKLYSLGVVTNRDEWTYGFTSDEVTTNINTLIKNYNYEVFRLIQEKVRPKNIDEFVNSHQSFLKWTDRLKDALQKRQTIEFEQFKVRKALYRPFCFRYLYFDHLLNQSRYQQYRIFPVPASEHENISICLTGLGSEKPFMVFTTNYLPDLHLVGAGAGTQCFPFYTYSEDGSDRRENITDWALGQFRARYGETVTKWDIFHYVYAVLHSPTYRQRYAENLKRDLPRIPLLPVADWPGWVAAGERLAKLHRDYETVTPYRLKRLETPGLALDWRIADKMRLSPDKRSLKYNEWLTLTDIPPRVFEYRLGNRSALEWVIDQYRVSTDTRSGLTHDPNDPAQPDAIVQLVEQVVRVSLDTLDILDGLPPLSLDA